MKFKAQVLLVLLVVLILIGFAASAYAGALEQRLPTPILVVNTSFLNARSGPGPQYSVITTLTGGSELPVLGTNDDTTWYLVTTPVGSGWVDVSFTLPRGDFTNVPEISIDPPVVAQTVPLTIGLPTTSATASGARGVPVPVLDPGHVVVNTSALNVRSSPGGQYSVVTVVYGGDVLTVAGVAPDQAWWLVTGAFGRGWVDSEFVVFRGTIRNVPIVRNAY
jgi:uncharacterized protein YgiM (DUF1202 family)